MQLRFSTTNYSFPLSPLINEMRIYIVDAKLKEKSALKYFLAEL